MANGISTVGTFLKTGASASNLAKISPIKTHPQIGSQPENLDTTDMEDSMSTSTPGVQQLDAMDFTMNYTKEGYEAWKAKDYLATNNAEQFYQLEFGADAEQGVFSWKGRHSIFISEGSVNGVREMTLSVFPSTIIIPHKAADITDWTKADGGVTTSGT